MDVTVLQCSGTIEWFTATQAIIKRTKYNQMTTKLLRSEFRDLILQIESGKMIHKFVVDENVSIHKKFLAEGKATVNFPNSKAVVMFHNAPAANLVPFLKTLFVKISSKKQSPKVKLREQLLSGKAHILQDISPINVKDMRRVKNEMDKRDAGLTAIEKKRKHHKEQKEVRHS